MAAKALTVRRAISVVVIIENECFILCHSHITILRVLYLRLVSHIRSFMVAILGFPICFWLSTALIGKVELTR